MHSAQAAAHRSMKQFARHVRAGILTTSMPSAAKTSSNVAVYVVGDTFTARWRHFDRPMSRASCRRLSPTLVTAGPLLL